jgi:hypothetical protein
VNYIINSIQDVTILINIDITFIDEKIQRILYAPFGVKREPSDFLTDIFHL